MLELEIGVPSQPKIVGYIILVMGLKWVTKYLVQNFKTGGIENCDCPELGIKA